MSSQNEYPEKYSNYYNQIINICEKCELYSALDDECLVDRVSILDIVTSENPICPIGEW